MSKEISRLTVNDEDCSHSEACMEGVGYQVKDSSNCVGCTHNTISYNKLAEYEDAEQNEKLLILPVPIGESFYTPYAFVDTDGSVIRGIFTLQMSGYIKKGSESYCLSFEKEIDLIYTNIKDVYITFEEAKAVLDKIECVPICEFKYKNKGEKQCTKHGG